MFLSFITSLQRLYYKFNAATFILLSRFLDPLWTQFCNHIEDNGKIIEKVAKKVGLSPKTYLTSNTDNQERSKTKS